MSTCTFLEKSQIKDLSKKLDALVPAKKLISSPIWGPIAEMADGPFFNIMLTIANTAVEEKVSQEKADKALKVFEYIDKEDAEGLIKYLSELSAEEFDLSDTNEELLYNTLMMFKSYVKLALEKIKELNEDADEQDGITAEGSEEIGTNEEESE